MARKHKLTVICLVICILLCGCGSDVKYAELEKRIAQLEKELEEVKAEKATCILSTGMAGAKGYPRFFNPPEIVVVDVCPA